MATTAASGVSVELVPLARLTLKLDPPLVLQNTPSGTRYIIGVKSGRLEGDRIHASVKAGPTADWVTVSSDGTATLDVRATFETDDGALIYCHRYAWLNKIQAIAKGRVSEDMSDLVYEIFELR